MFRGLVGVTKADLNFISLRWDVISIDEYDDLILASIAPVPTLINWTNRTGRFAFGNRSSEHKHKAEKIRALISPFLFYFYLTNF